MQRGEYNEIALSSLPEATANVVRGLVRDATNGKKVDEHGNWDFGCEFDRKGRGSSINWDLYAIGSDSHSGDTLAVIQIRQFIRRSARRFPEIKKSYFLLGKNEDGTTFAHCVESRVIHHAIKVGSDVVLAVQDWMFGGDYKRMVRQGDLALYPVSRAVGEKETRRTATLQGSHKLKASQIRKTDTGIYAKNPELTHLPGTHPFVSGEGWYRIIVGRRASHWDFAAPTID